MSGISGVCASNGIDVHYLRTGGAKPPLVLLHGLTGGGRCWIPLARSLRSEYDVVMPDARGHGRSSTPSAGYNYDELASDVLGLIEALGLVQPVLLGHSMGGMTAAVVAARNGQNIRGVVLADPTFLDPPRQLEVYRSDVVEQHRRFLTLTHDEQRTNVRVRHPQRSAELVELVVEARRNTRPQAWQILTPPNPDFSEQVSILQMPLLLVLAERGVVSVATAQRLRALNAQVRIEQIQGAGHALQYDQPQQFESVVRAFLRSLVQDR